MKSNEINNNIKFYIFLEVLKKYSNINPHEEISKEVKKTKLNHMILSVKEINEMSLKDLNELEVYKLAKESNVGIAYLNIQQDINELDRKSTGEVDYSRYKARTTRKYLINKGDGISFENISELEDFIPEYYVKDALKIGSTMLYILEKMQK